MNQEPYLIETVISKVRHYNPEYGTGRICVCGHEYSRHFDHFEPEFDAVGCKYCDCFDFIEGRILQNPIDLIYEDLHE